MLKRLEWDIAALQELEDSIAWYAERNERAARRMVKEVHLAAQSLVAPELPANGRPGMIAGTRELVVGQRTHLSLSSSMKKADGLSSAVGMTNVIILSAFLSLLPSAPC